MHPINLFAMQELSSLSQYPLSHFVQTFVLIESITRQLAIVALKQFFSTASKKYPLSQFLQIEEFKQALQCMKHYLQ